jgi:hypothetical protein
MMLILERRLEFGSTIWIATTMPQREIDHANAPIKKHSAMEGLLQFSEIRCGRGAAELYVYPHCYPQPERPGFRQRRQAFLMRYFTLDRAEVRGAKHEHYRSACRV